LTPPASDSLTTPIIHFPNYLYFWAVPNMQYRSRLSTFVNLKYIFGVNDDVKVYIK